MHTLPSCHWWSWGPGPPPSVMISGMHAPLYLGCLRYEEAFNYALSLENVDTVAWLCGQLEPGMLAEEPCPLSQGVLLALLQQLGFDLSKDPLPKLAWIRDAALALKTQVGAGTC
jgi:hypothetical protein